MKQIGYIGLGKMGKNMVLRLIEKGWDVVVYDVNPKAVREMAEAGATTASSIGDMARQLESSRLVWMMVPHDSVDSVLAELRVSLTLSDTIIDGGNSNFKDTIHRAKELQELGINLVDVGVSGGPNGARNGACVMVGGRHEQFLEYQELYKDVAATEAYQYVGDSGAGHFVKMVHNGIEYGMMQAIAEGFAVMRSADLVLNLKEISNVYNHKSVIESRLMGWLSDAFKDYGEKLEGISGTVGHSGEGEWTINYAKEIGVPVPAIESALKFRIDSEKKPSFSGKILSALRYEFGGHEVKEGSEGS